MKQEQFFVQQLIILDTMKLSLEILTFPIRIKYRNKQRETSL